MEILNEIKTNEMLVKVHNVTEPFYCKIIEVPNEDLSFHYDAEYVSNLEATRCRTYEEAFDNLCLYLAELKEPLQQNTGY